VQAPPNSATKFEIERLAADLQFVDGIAWSRTGFLAVADVRANKIYRFDAAPRPRVLRDKTEGTSGLAYDIQGRLYMCESGARRVTRMDRQGDIEPFLESFEGKKFNSPNDIVVRRDGHVYFTDPAFGSADDHRELDFHGIFHANPKGEVDAFAKWKTRPNGITLSPDGRLLYVTDSDRHAVVAFDLDRNGIASNQRDLAKKISGVPGGVKTDVTGRLYVAGRGVTILTPAGKVEAVFLDDRNTVNCSFGEGDSETLFVSSRSDIFRAKMGVKGAFQY
jgi:gluconolactonase